MRGFTEEVAAKMTATQELASKYPCAAATLSATSSGMPLVYSKDYQIRALNKLAYFEAVGLWFIKKEL